MKRATKRQATAPKSKNIAEPATSESGKKLSLLSPEMSGWKRIQEWPKLFVLYRRGEEYLAELQPELSYVEKRLASGHSPADLLPDKLGRAMWFLALFEYSKRDPAIDSNSFGFIPFRNIAIELLSETLGGLAGKLFFSSKEAAENSYMDMVALVKRTGEGVVKRRFNPMSYKGNLSLPLLAIWHAKILCEHHGRLPSKAEVKERLSMIGLGFSKKSKAAKQNWSSVFHRAGLGELPDIPL
jgi:hypothetical protein